MNNSTRWKTERTSTVSRWPPQAMKRCVPRPPPNIPKEFSEQSLKSLCLFFKKTNQQKYVCLFHFFSGMGFGFLRHDHCTKAACTLQWGNGILFNQLWNHLTNKLWLIEDSKSLTYMSRTTQHLGWLTILCSDLAISMELLWTFQSQKCNWIAEMNKKHTMWGPYSGRALPNPKDLYLSKGLQRGNCLNSCRCIISGMQHDPFGFSKHGFCQRITDENRLGAGLQGSQGRHLVNDFEGIRTSAASTIWPKHGDACDKITETATNEAKGVTLERSKRLNRLSTSHNLPWLIQAGYVYHCIIWML